MPSHWPIRTKLKLGLGLLLFTVLALFGSAYYGLYAYRGLVRSLSARSAELPLASNIRQHVNELRIILSQASERLEVPGGLESLEASAGGRSGSNVPWDVRLLRAEYLREFETLVEAVDRYRRQLDHMHNDADPRLGDDSHERETLAKIDQVLDELNSERDENWILNPTHLAAIRHQVDVKLRHLVSELPSHLHKRLQHLSDNVKAQYRTAIITAWWNVGMAVVLLVTAVRMFIRWFARPLQTLVEGSRMVALGKFDYRIHMDTRDEMGELAVAMNDMTARFREVRDDLDRQVRERTSQVVRSEQLASVGFLAAGVAHEINNPLASIAICSESLDSRIREIFESDEKELSEDVELALNYLQMIQREAFRCKQITEKLLDFARLGDSQRHLTDLRELVADVIEMVQHLGKYQEKKLELLDGSPVTIEVNAQEIKQVVLNLVTNGLESIDPEGKVEVTVVDDGTLARIIVEDNGCGMSEEVQEHLFKPFFTRRRGGQGTGLGLSITYRIVQEHDGTIEALSDGVGKGSRFVVSLPSHSERKETSHQYQAA